MGKFSTIGFVIGVMLLLGATTLYAADKAVFGDGFTGSQDFCRTYMKQVIVDGQEKPAYGTTCLQPDGSWMVRTPATIEPQPFTPPIQMVVTPSQLML